MSYRPQRGGHAGGHLRDPFIHLIETGEIPGDADHQGKPLTAWSLTGLLWNCTDILPGSECSELDLPQGSTYARAARAVRAGLHRP